MRYLPLGQSGIEASVIAFGAWQVGGWMWGGQEEGQSVRAVRAALDAGINLIDTAPMYGFGESERIVGKAIKGRRDKVVLATKCGMRWDLKKGKLFFRTTEQAIDPAGDRDVHIYCGPESIREEVERSLERLGVDHIDLLQTHWQDETTPIEETAGEMLRLKDEGKIRAIGACNATAGQLARYASVAPIDTDQEKYSLLFRDAEQEQLPHCRGQNLAFLAYSPLANGLLTGKVPPDRTFPPGDLRTTRPLFSMENRRSVAAMLAEIQPIAEAHRVTLSQLVLGWTLAQPGVTHALVGARNEPQSRENAAAADIQLSKDELARITSAASRVSLHL